MLAAVIGRLQLDMERFATEADGKYFSGPGLRNGENFIRMLGVRIDDRNAALRKQIRKEAHFGADLLAAFLP